MTCSRRIIVIITCLISVVISESCVLPKEFIEDYFSNKQIKTIAFVSCEEAAEDANITRIKYLLSTGKFWVVFTYPEKLSCLEVNYYKVGIVLEYECFTKQHFEETEQNLFNATYHWLICSKVRIEDTSLSSHPFNIDTEVTWATTPERNSARFALHDLYKTTPRSPVIATHAGHWSPEAGLSYSVAGYKYERRRDLRNITLRAGIVINVLPVDKLTERLASHENRKLDSMARFNYAIFAHVRDIYNFGVVLHVSNSSGYQDGVTKKFDGIIGMLQQREIDVAISSVFILSARLDTVDFAGPAWKFRSAAIFRHPSSSELHQALLLPFNGEVWLCCFLVWVLITTTLRLTAWVQGECSLCQHDEDFVEDSWSAALVIAVGALSQQGSSSTSRLLTWRVVFISSILLATLLNNFYSASVVSSMLAPVPKTIKTLRALIDSPLTVGSENLAYSTNYFKYTTDPLAKELFAKKLSAAPPKRKSASFFNMSEGIARIKTEDFAFNAEAISIYPLLNEALTEREICSLAEVEVMPLSTSFIPIQKHSPYKKLIEYGVRRVWERGLASREERIWRAKPPYCVQASDEIASVDLDDVATAFVLLLAGVATSLLVFVGELAVHSGANARVKAGRGAKPRASDPVAHILRYTRTRKVFNKKHEVICYYY